MSVNDKAIELLKTLWLYQGKHEDQLKPCLYGVTGSGKTAIIKHLKKELFPSLHMHRINLAAVLPEDITGLPGKTPKKRTEYYPLESLWALSKEPGILFLDEIGHAKPDNVPAALTLILEGRVQELVLHPESTIICASQPVDVEAWASSEAYKAMAARLCFIPIQDDWSYVENKWKCYGLAEVWREQDKTTSLPEPPLMKRNSRTIDWVLEILSAHSLDQDLEDMLLTGTLRETDRTVFTDWRKHSGWGINIVRLIQQGHAMELYETLSLHEMIKVLPLVMIYGKAEDILVYEKTLIKVGSMLSPELAEETVKSIYNGLLNEINQKNVAELNIFSDATPEQFGQAHKNIEDAIEKEKANHVSTTSQVSGS